MTLYTIVFLMSLVLLSSLTSFNIYIVVLVSAILLLIMPKNRYWDNMSIHILLFSFLYALVLVIDHRVVSWANTISYMICPIVFYRIGRYIVDKSSEYGLITILTLLIVSYTLPLLAVTINSISETGEIVNIYRSLGSDEFDDSILGATYYGLHASFGLASISALSLSMKNVIIQKIMLIGCALAALLTTIHLVNRAGLIIFILCLLLTIFYSTRGNIVKRMLLLATCTFILFFILYMNNDTLVTDIFEAYLSREEDAEFNLASGGGRIQLSKNVIEKMLSNPFGMPQEEYAHNLWLDIIRVAGFLPIIPFFIATYMNYRNLYYNSKSNNTIMPFLLSINLGVSFVCMMEPVVEGCALYFYLVIMVWGINTGVFLKQRSIINV